MFWQNFITIRQSTYPINSLKEDVFLLKLNARFYLVKVCEQLTPCPEIITPKKLQTNGKTGSPTVGKGKSKTRTKRVFESSGSSVDAKLFVGVWPNQEPLSLMQGFFLCLTKWSFSFLLWAVFFVFFTQGLFSDFDFSIGVIVKSFHLGIFVKCMM